MSSNSEFLRHAPNAELSPLYNVYWSFAAERQRIFFNRLRRVNDLWTRDPIFQTYKFTNAYRASDRVSQYLIRHVIYRDDLPGDDAEIFFRIILFKMFNKIETWQALEDAFGRNCLEGFDVELYDRVLLGLLNRGHSIYSGAYIMHPGTSVFGQQYKHQNHLRLIALMVEDGVAGKLATCQTMQEGYELLRSYPMIGNFLSYQFITDINYSDITDFGEDEFVVPGPGALDGIAKCFVDTGGLSPADVIRVMAEIQNDEFARLGLEFQDLWGRKLQLIDCQNLFCEISKYSRVSHPDIQGVSGRRRIKQKFVCNEAPIDFWYPPKWGINERVVVG